MRQIIIVCAFVLGGCANQAEIKAAALRDDDATCHNMGFERGSDEYKKCRFTSYEARENRQAMIGAAYAGRPSTYQTFQLPRQNSYGYGVNVDTFGMLDAIGNNWRATQRGY